MRTKSVLVLEHHPADSPGAILHALKAHGANVHEVRAHQGDAVPETMGDAAALVVMGGPMSIHDEEAHPFLRTEKRLIASALEAGLPVLGVCLGAQLLAAVLGGGVTRAPALEIGWHEVKRSAADPLFDLLPPGFTPFHWHGDAIVLPPGALRLAQSTMTEVQAFRWQQAYGLQFHLESDAAMIATMVESFGPELDEAHIPKEALEVATRANLAAQERLARVFFGRWAETL